MKTCALYRCKENITFQFEGTTYKQVDGAVLGGPLCPTLADILLATIKQKPHEEIKKTHSPKPYVDDILISTSDIPFETSLNAQNMGELC